jgi:acetyltransferase EpsM
MQAIDPIVMKKPLVIWGASGYARVVADIIRLAGEYDILGMLDDVRPERRGEIVGGVAVLGGREQWDEIKRQGATHVIVAVGHCAARVRLADFAVAHGLKLATAIHPGAIVASDALISPGTVIAAGAVVNPAVTIGRNCLINTCASVDHDCTIGDGVHIGPGVRLGGHTTIGKGAWLGIGAITCDRIHIGAGSVIGAGAVITRDIPPGVVAYGVPGRVMRNVNDSGT